MSRPDKADRMVCWDEELTIFLPGARVRVAEDPGNHPGFDATVSAVNFIDHLRQVTYQIVADHKCFNESYSARSQRAGNLSLIEGPTALVFPGDTGGRPLTRIGK